MFTTKRIISADLNDYANDALVNALDVIDGFFYAAENAGATPDSHFTNPQTGETFSAAELGRVCGILHGLLDTTTWTID